MKRLKSLWFALILCSSFGAASQITYCDAKGDYFKTFQQSTLVFIKTGDQEFDKAVESSLEDYWTQTPYEIISVEDLEEYNDVSKYSYLTIMSVSITYGTRSSYTKGLAIIIYDEEASMLKNLITYYPFRENKKQTIPYLDFAISGKNQLVEKLANREIKYETPSYYPVRQGKAFNKSSLEQNLGRGKTLLVAKEDLHERLIKEDYKYLHKEYKHPIKVLNEQTYLDALKGDAPNNSLILIYLDLGGWLTQIYDPSTKQLIYSGTFGDLSGIYNSKGVKLTGGNLAPFGDWMKKQNK